MLLNFLVLPNFVGINKGNRFNILLLIPLSQLSNVTGIIMPTFAKFPPLPIVDLSPNELSIVPSSIPDQLTCILYGYPTQGKNESLRARAILRSLVPLSDLEGVLSLPFTLRDGEGEEASSSDMPPGQRGGPGGVGRGSLPFTLRDGEGEEASSSDMPPGQTTVTTGRRRVCHA